MDERWNDNRIPGVAAIWASTYLHSIHFDEHSWCLREKEETTQKHERHGNDDKWCSIVIAVIAENES